MTAPMCEEVLIVLRKILRAISIQSRQLAQTIGLTTPQLLILRVLDRLGGMPVGALSREVNLSQATVTAIIDRMERKGLVVRGRSDVDRRKVQVSLTPAAEEVLERAPSPIQESFANAFSRLETWEQTLILSSLQRVAAMMDATDLPAGPLLVDDSQLPET